MDDWKDEEQIKAELRLLTRQLKELRGELTDLLSPPKSSHTRALLHRKGWPGEANDVGDLSNEREFAEDRERKRLPTPRPPKKG